MMVLILLSTSKNLFDKTEIFKQFGKPINIPINLFVNYDTDLFNNVFC